MVFKTSKRRSNGGKMVKVSNFKLSIHKGVFPIGLTLKKIEKIRLQTKKMLYEMDAIKKYQPFTSGAPKRRPRQVGA